MEYRACAEAAKHGHFEVLLWLIQQGCPHTPEIIYHVVRHGDVEILKWFLEKNYLEWFRGRKNLDERFEDVPDLCEEAAGYGQLEMLKYLRSQHFEWNQLVTRKAVQNGFLDVLQWCVANGCPVDDHLCNLAGYEGHTEIVKWLHANNHV